MGLFNFVAILLTVVAVLAYVNDRYVKLPTAIGLMGISLLVSMGLVALGRKGVDLETPTRQILAQANFGETLMRGMLSFLLFAGAIQFRLKDLAQQKHVIALLATVGVAASTFIIGAILFGIAQLAGVELSFIYCLVFGALISPTDPVAVLAVLKGSGTPKALEAKIAGESLFNDGVAVVLFVLLIGIATGKGEALTADDIWMMLLRQIAGGAIFGSLAGWIGFRMLRKAEQYSVQVLITLAVACGVYAVATEAHLSGPIAVVVSALVIGSMQQSTPPPRPRASRADLESFWELIDELLNSVLFVWVGLAVLAFTFTRAELRAGLIAVPVTLLGRFLSIWLAAVVFGFQKEFDRKTYLLMTWGGLRGGISVALVLSLPVSPEQDLLLSITYVVVVFSILVQGLTIGKITKLLRPT